MKPFHEWVMEPIKPLNQLPELPEGVVETARLGHYLYQCRSCDGWFPMDWELDEDSYESHFCGSNERCCP